ncbi:MAG: DUF418 domain-containing protein [Bacteroidota bacterium]
MSSLSATDAPVAAPLNKKERILFIDSIRGIALLGILLMNSMAQSQAHWFYNNMNLNQPITGKNFYAWVLEMGVFEGTMRGLFSILFGAGTILLISRLEKTRGHLDAADIYYRRILWLLVFGLINSFIFLWLGDILYSYALCGLVLFPFRKMSPRNLWIGVFILLAFGTYRESASLYDNKETIAKGKKAELLKTQHKKLTKEQTGDLEKWHGYRDKNDSKGIMKQAMEETAKVQKSNYKQLFVYYRDINMNIESWGFYNSWWDMLMFFFIGMALFKSGFLTGNSPNWQYATIAVLGIGLGLAINYMGLKMMYHARFDAVKLTETAPFEIYQIRRFVQTMGYLSLLVLLYKLVPLRGLFHLLAPVGQMAFTNYLSQSIIAAIIYYGMGWFGYFQRYQIYEIVAAIWVFQIITSTIWLKYFLFGPFEWLWRSLTYMKLQPIKRVKEDVPPDAVSGTVANL